MERGLKELTKKLFRDSEKFVVKELTGDMIGVTDMRKKDLKVANKAIKLYKKVRQLAVLQAESTEDILNSLRLLHEENNLLKDEVNNLKVLVEQSTRDVKRMIQDKK